MEKSWKSRLGQIVKGLYPLLPNDCNAVLVLMNNSSSEILRVLVFPSAIPFRLNVPS